MRISGLQELLEKAKEEYGDTTTVVKHNGVAASYDEIDYIDVAWYGNGYGYVPAIVVG